MLMNFVGKLINQKKDGINVNFEDMQKFIRENDAKNYGANEASRFILISTLGESEQHCLISKTLDTKKEREIINENLKNTNKLKIIIYGKNASDETVDKKFSQLKNLGFHNVFIYRGGLFEWLMLQDIYGDDEFITTSRELDIIQYRNPSIF